MPSSSRSWTFFEVLDVIEPVDPADTRLVPADSPQFLKTRLWLAARGRLEILEARLLGYSPRLANAPALIRWRPAQPGRAVR